MTDDDDTPAPAAPVYDAQTLRIAQATPDQVALDPARFQPIGSSESPQMTRMLDSDGNEYEVPASSAQQALNQGWTFLGGAAAERRGQVERVKAQLGGAAAEGARSFVNQALMGVPEVIKQHQLEQTNDPELMAQALRESAQEHATARVIGGGLGLVASTLATGGMSSAVGGAAEQGAVRAMTGAGAAAAEGAIAPGLLARATGYAARGAAEGAFYAAPQAVAQAAYGDVDKASEAMMWGMGTAGLVGLGVGGFREAANAVAGGLTGALRDAAVSRGLVDSAGQVSPTALSDLATSGRRDLLGLTGAGADKLASGDVGALEQYVRDNGLRGANPAKLAAARDAAQSALDAHASTLDSALAKASAAEHASVGIVPTDLAAKVQDQVLGARPGLSTPMFAPERNALDDIVKSISSYGDKPVPFADAQQIRDLVAQKIPQLAGAAPGALSPTEQVAKQVYDVVTAEQQRAMGEAYGKLGLDADFGRWLGDKQSLANATQLAELAPRGIVPQGIAGNAVTAVGGYPAKAIGSAIGAGGTALAGPYGGMLGYHMGKAIAGKMLDHVAGNGALDIATSALSKLADSPQTLPWLGAALAKGSVDAASTKIADMVAQLGSRAALEARDPVKNYLGPQANGLSRDQQYDRVASALAQAKADPARVGLEAQTMGHALGGGDPALANALAQRQQATVGYLSSALPMDSNPPAPFAPAGTTTWTPDPSAKQAFLDKLEISQDPARALAHAQSGTLTEAHVDALTSLYPQMHQQILGELSQLAYDPRAPALNEGVKLDLAKLSGVPLNNMRQINYQGVYQQAQSSSGPNPTPKGSPRGSRAPHMTHLPSLATSTQAAEQRASR